MSFIWQLRVLTSFWHLAGAPEMVAEMNWFGKRQGITILLTQMGKLRPKALVGVFALCFALQHGLSPKRA